MVGNYVQALMRNITLPSGHAVKGEHIGIVTPYKRQVSELS